jgi:putative glutamine amidotransferase
MAMAQPVIGLTASIDHRAPAFGETYSLTRKYADGVRQAGGVPVIVPHNLDEETTPRDYLAHPVKIDPGSQLARVMQLEAARTNSWHHQSIRQAADRLRVTAVAPDGVIEAVEVPGLRFVIGVQWHPEWMFEEYREQRRLFEGLVQASLSTNR